MLLVPPGTYDMGCSASDQHGCDSQENSVHPVTLTRAFYLARYEVTQSEWIAKVGSNPSAFQGASYPDSGNRPVENVSWNMIQGFLANTGLRLPTEAEWEFSCRAGSTLAFHSMQEFPNGTNQDASAANIAWFSANSAGQTRPVGTRTANALGLHDMLGNVWEYVSDWYRPSFDASAVTDPTGPATGTSRVRRGGCFADAGTHNLRTSTRGGETPNWVDVYFGFRVARNP
jgi:formylglycine-generating enzyme required for sulfatase activity